MMLIYRKVSISLIKSRNIICLQNAGQKIRNYSSGKTKFSIGFFFKGYVKKKKIIKIIFRQTKNSALKVKFLMEDHCI